MSRMPNSSPSCVSWGYPDATVGTYAQYPRISRSSNRELCVDDRCSLATSVNAESPIASFANVALQLLAMNPGARIHFEMDDDKH